VESRTQLYAQGALPGRELDTAQAALVQAQAAFDSAQKHLAGMREVGREAAIKGAQGQLESAKGRYLGSQAQLSYSEVRSPINGVVTERALFTGETAAAGAPLLTVMDTSALLAKVHLPQLHAQLLKVGSPAEATIPGVDGPVEGEVTLISPALDPGSTTVEVWVRIENPKGTFKPGGAAKVSLEGKTVARALVAPSEAVLSMPSGKKAVMTIGADGAAHRSEVETGIADDGFVQIVSGIKAGARVVTKGAYSLDDDTRVKVVAPSDDKDGDTKAPEDKPASGHDSGATK
jgi:RND family efflux transporter MFP subunit